MPKFKVTVTETDSKLISYIVEADTKEEAVDRAYTKWQLDEEPDNTEELYCESDYRGGRLMVKLVCEREEAIDILFDDHYDFRVVEEKITSQSRWNTYREAIVKQLSTGDYFRVGYSRGSTEYQDEGMFGYEDEVEFTQVFPVDTIVTIYRSEEEIKKGEN